MTITYGATWSTDSTDFGVWSPAAERMELCLFSPQDLDLEISRVEMTRSGEDWTCSVPDLAPGTGYGFRAYGPYDPKNGHRFNPAKLLVDPYAKAIHRDVTWQSAVFGYPIGDEDSATPDATDSTRFVPRSIVVDTSFDWESTTRPMTPLDRSFIYEVHVKGLTISHPDVPPELRGTYLGACHPAVIAHLQSLGVTAIEFLPVHTHVNDGFLVERGLTNYWGYNTLGFFSPDYRYASTLEPGAEVREFKEMVREFHKAGIEVILDVVYNHTAEANHQGPTLSFRGLHNAEFYWLSPEDQSRNFDLTGTGNTVNVDHPGVTRFVADSLRYWVEEMGVDGFRFDLAPVVGRTEIDFDRHAPIFETIQQDPVLSTAKMIAEPWDLGPGGYQVGGFPDNWSEWNDRYRDIVRSFWRSDDGKLQEMGFRLTGSADFYHARAFGPCSSVNFVAAHDGMTTADLIAFQHKRNYGNGDNNNDGHENDVNQFIGPDGLTNDPEIKAERAFRARTLLGTVLVSRGIPMILGGDEIGRTQMGSNNAYCQDSPISWIDWSLAKENANILEFVQACARLRQQEPALRIERFPDDSLEEVDPWIWFNESGNQLSEGEWDDSERRSFGILVDSAVDEGSSWLALLFNAGGDMLKFEVPIDIAEGAGSVELVLTSADGEHELLAAPAGSISIYRIRRA